MATRPGDETTARTELLAEQLGNQPEDGEALRSLLELYEERVASEPKPENKAALWAELATLCQRAGNTYGAVAALERARARAPEDVRLTHALASALVERSAKADGPTKAIYLDRVADLLCDVALALDATEARKFLSAALGHAPWHGRALYELERATPEGERGELAGFWVAYLAHNPEGDLARERRVSLARAYLAAGQPEDAIFALEPAASQGHEEALVMLASLRPARRSSPAAAAAAQDTSAATVARYVGPDHALHTLSASLLEDAPDYETRVAPAPTMPDEHNALTRVSAMPQEPLLRILEGADRPSAPPPRASSRFPAERSDPSASPELVALRAELKSASAAGDSARALQCARALANADPNDDLAFEYMEREFRRTRDHRERAEWLLQMAQPEAVPRAKRRQRARDAIALFEQKLGDAEGAVRAYRTLLKAEPDSDEALRGLARVLERTGNWDAWCECYERMLVVATDTTQKSGLLRRISDVHRRERGDRTAAAAALARLIELEPNDRAARIALTDDYTALSRWDDLARLLERRVEEPASKAERIALLRQLAELFEGPLADSSAAFEAYERIVALSPEDNQALTRMEEIDEQTGDYERLLTTFTRRTERAAPSQAAGYWLRMAQIAETHLLDRDRAYRFLRQALTAAPQNVAVADALADLCDRSGRDQELLELLRERSRSEKQGKARNALLRRTARLLIE
ncbi:MAG: hypothetical protein RL701_6648, partial [Pseudomonadota bacterium]